MCSELKWRPGARTVRRVRLGGALRRTDDTVDFRLTTRPDADGEVWSWVSRCSTCGNAPCGRTGWRRVRSGSFWTCGPTRAGTVLRWLQIFEMREDVPFDDEAMTARLNAASRTNMAHIKAVVEARVIYGSC